MKHFYLVEVGGEDEGNLSYFMKYIEEEATLQDITLKVTEEFYR